MSLSYGTVFEWISQICILRLLVTRKVSDLLHAIQVHEGRSARPAVFFAGLAFFLSLLSSTVSCWSLSFTKWRLETLGIRLRLVLLLVGLTFPRCCHGKYKHLFNWWEYTQHSNSYIDIRRGAYIILIVGIAIQPWKILNVWARLFHLWLLLVLIKGSDSQ